jgi:predicted heme/steroid binding protein
MGLFPRWLRSVLLGLSILLLTAWSGGCGGGRAIQPNPVPTLSSISPTTATAGGPAVTLAANGTNFNANTAVNWNGNARTTTLVNSTQITAAISAADIAAAGTAQVTAINPLPDGGTSAEVSFTIAAVNNPPPTISGLAPNNTTAGAPPFTLVVNGTNFVISSAVKWNGGTRTTTFVSATQITAAISATDIMAAGAAQVTVTNPAPGGGTSPCTAFDINAATSPVPTVSNISPTNDTAGGSALTLTVNGINLVPRQPSSGMARRRRRLS